ncbi:Predicted N-acetyltransferase YhbS [Paracoccus saliphilus]|uniref:N-acetyltransferase n=1 Tax=Paracoccus saliphilus TaxID=405559 RepID=A0AA45W4B3_9RHOB|nr:N-acetyltransferase [Paracoccus saliphilus]SIS83792.1 Predicted N-acetyltransferase YhbS [Paracoccus saliphilus]
MFEIRPETPADEYEIETLYDLCFAPGRTALSSYRLREGVDRVADLCLLLRDPGGFLQAAIRYWPVRVAGHRALLLGPIAVHPTAQGEGLGGFLMHDSLERAREMGWARVLLVGDAPYYSRFGFARLDGVEMPPPTNPDRVLGLELQDRAWAGIAGEVTRDPGAETTSGLADGAEPSHIYPTCHETGQPRDGQDDDETAAGAASDQRSERS